jgi:hypothetical protein
LTRKRAAGGLFAVCIFTYVGNLHSAAITAAESAFEVRLLGATAVSPTVLAVTGGSLDDQFEPLANARFRGPGVFWLKLKSAEGLASTGATAARATASGATAADTTAARATVAGATAADAPGAGATAAGATAADATGAGIPVVVMHAARPAQATVYAARAGAAVALPQAVQLPGFRGIQDTVFTYVEGLHLGQPLYVRLTVAGGDQEPVSFSGSTLDRTLARGAEHARMIALAFGALMAMALAALLIWFVLAERLFILYASLFFLQALYVAYLSGQGFDWPWLSYAQPLTSFAWNVPVGLSGAVACLFTREIADLKHFSPRIYATFGWFSMAFVVVTVANLAKFLGFGMWVNALGNVLFLAATVFTMVVAFLAWRRGNRAAGWFMIAWALLEGVTITAAVRFLFVASVDSSPLLYYYGLPLSMVAAAVLIALGVADRLRAQRAALTDAERRAQTDPLTGVLSPITHRASRRGLSAGTGARPADRPAVHRSRSFQANQRFLRPPGGGRLFARHHRPHSRGITAIGRHRPLRRRGVRRHPEQCRRGGRESHRAAHPGTGSRRTGGRIRQADPLDLQHRCGRQRYARRMG